MHLTGYRLAPALSPIPDVIALQCSMSTSCVWLASFPRASMRTWKRWVYADLAFSGSLTMVPCAPIGKGQHFADNMCSGLSQGHW